MINKHNNGYWYELLAKSTLKTVFPQEFKELESYDKPDLIDNLHQMGIEVIHPIDEKHMQLEAYYDKFLYKNKLSQVSEEGLKKFRDNSYDVIAKADDGIIYSYRKPHEEFNIELLYNAIDKKFKKLNQNQYSYANNISLYMEMAMCSIESMQQSIAEKILLYAKKLQKQYMMSYKEIFYNSLMVLYRINLETKKITQYDISHLSTYILQKFNIELEKS